MNGLLAFLGGMAGTAGQMYMKQEAEEKAHQRRMEEARTRAALDVWKQLAIDTQSPSKQVDREYKAALTDATERNAESLTGLRREQINKVGLEARAMEDKLSAQEAISDAKSKLDLCRQVAENPGDCDEYARAYNDVVNQFQTLYSKVPSRTGSDTLDAKRRIDALAKVYETKCAYSGEKDSPFCKQLDATIKNLSMNIGGASGAEPAQDAGARLDAVLQQLGINKKP